MKCSFRLLLSLVTCLLVAPLAQPRAATVPHFWSKRFGDASSQVAQSAAIDASGNVFIAVYGAGTIDFGGGGLTSAGGNDIFLAKFGPTGAYQWSKVFGDASSQAVTGVTTDPSGNVIIAGYFQGTVNFGGSLLTTAGVSDIYIAKFSPNGTHLWSGRFGDVSQQYAMGVATDASSNVFMAGYYQGAVNFGGATLTSAGSNDIYLVKFNAAGTHQWSQRFGDTNQQQCGGVAVDPSGNVLISGEFGGTLNFGGSFLVAQSFDIYVAKFNNAGVHQWSARYGDANDSYGRGIATDGSGSVYITGFYNGTLNFGGSNLVSSGGNDVFLAKFNSSGVHQWSKRFGDASAQNGYGVAADAAGNVTVVGDMVGSADFEGGTLTSTGSTDAFAARYNAAGVHQWSQHFGDATQQTAFGVAVDAAGNTAVVGEMAGFTDFGGGGLSSAGSYDAFVARFGANGEPQITSISDIGNDQGGKVKIFFKRSGGDDIGNASPVTRYDALRRDDAPPALSAKPGQPIRDSGWIQVGSVDAFAKGNYGIVVPTIGDSTLALGPYTSVFRIRAVTATPGTFFDSPPDSGYSLDNLAPGIPSNFMYAVGDLNWDKSNAPDFDYFTIYGSNSSSFGSATLINYTVAPTMNVAASPYAYYFATATDFSGNEGKPALVNTLSAVGNGPASYVLSISSYPNPFNPRTTLRYTLPANGHVSVRVYDTRGALVATLVDEEQRAGAYSTRWDGRDAKGVAVSSGVYYARVTHSSGSKSYKMVLLK